MHTCLNLINDISRPKLEKDAEKVMILFPCSSETKSSLQQHTWSQLPKAGKILMSPDSPMGCWVNWSGWKFDHDLLQLSLLSFYFFFKMKRYITRIWFLIGRKSKSIGTYYLTAMDIRHEASLMKRFVKNFKNMWISRSFCQWKKE